VDVVRNSEIVGLRISFLSHAGLMGSVEFERSCDPMVDAWVEGRQ